MNNPEATRIVRAQLAAAHLADAGLDVRSRDVTVSPGLFATVRTTVVPYPGVEFSNTDLYRVIDVLSDLPGQAEITSYGTHVVAYWNGGV